MIIHAENISLRQEQHDILAHIDWTVKEGEHWCLLGLNGSGKTTLLNMVNGYIWPTEGQMTVLGKRFGEYDLRELRKRIGWVSTSMQEMLHGSETALRVVISGKFASIGIYESLSSQDEVQAISLMHRLGCEELMEREYGTLSQGEKQRILIARALMAQPRLLILDEPCTGLDLFAREQLLGMIAGVAAQPDAPTIIYVTHHIEEILPCFDHTLLLKQGSVFAAGGTEEVLTSSVLTAFFGVEVEVEQREARRWLYISS
ncbi:ABC transporter ATP-binding protein [Paenibacillus sp. GCM10023252]|uniref:ABC transporter ATP-binding protein n=1 Tax=Paenibacillus sp. GCM10023252 TaxID=3252649 RepID=UPI00360CD995